MKEAVPTALDGERVDRLVSLVADVSRAEAARLVEAGAVRVDGQVVAAGKERVHAGQVLELDDDARPGPVSLTPDPGVPVAVVHVDDDVVVVDKPAGVVVHPGAGNEAGTLVHGLLARYPEIAEVGQPDRPGIVHRLDKGTSGLLVVARTAAAYDDLVAQLSDRAVDRRYLALVWGRPDSAAGLIDAPIGRSTRDPARMAVVADGREARTRYERRAVFHEPADTALLECLLETGRTHQIRVHLAAIGYPVVGDTAYGPARALLDIERPFLHAFRLVFRHPTTGRRLEFESPLPADLQEVLAGLS